MSHSQAPAPGSTPKSRARRRLVAAALVVLLAIAAVIVLRGLMFRAKVSAYVSAAMGNLRIIHSACVKYSSNHPDVGFPASLRVLITPDAKGPAGSADSLTAETYHQLASGERQGYRFRYQPFDRDGDGRFEAYSVNADPIIEDPEWPYMYFYNDESGVIRYEVGKSATSSSQPTN